MKRKSLIIGVLLLFSFPILAQVGIGTTAPDASSILDIESTTGGLLIPRVTLVERNLIQDPMTMQPATGLLVYQTDNTPGFYYYDGMMWVILGGVGGDITDVTAGAGLSGGGTTGAVTITAEADNGLNVNGGADRIRLGGPLLEGTTITNDGFNMVFNLTSTGDFHIQDAGTNQFSVLDNGDINMDLNTLFVDASTSRVGVGTNMPTTTLDVDGRIRIRGGFPTAGDFLQSQDALGNAAWTRDGFGLIPIGSIVAWHGNIAGGLPALPTGWVECSGGTVIDGTSPINGRPIPNLNGNTISASGDSSRGRFLRGSTTSGIFEADASNNLRTIDADDFDSGGGFVNVDDDGGYTAWLNLDGGGGGFGGGNHRMRFRHAGVETRVANMTVRWIMRIK